MLQVMVVKDKGHMMKLSALLITAVMSQQIT